MSENMSRKIIVTSALTYANGPIHLGHMLEYIQTDIWHRFQNLIGNQSIYIGGDDAHGTAIMLRAEKENITPEELIARVMEEHQADLTGFSINLDNYYTTHSEENRELASNIYLKLQARGDTSVKTIKQAFDEEKQIFLPDRFIKGECPRCGAADQYGDNCEVCGATYSPTELINPRSVLSDTAPIEKESEHYFFQLPHYTEFLQQWSESGSLQSEIRNKLNEWFTVGLQDWDISRDAPYFGFEIPNAPGKYFYVWLDAPIGYMASFKNLCSQRKDLDFSEYWQKDSNTELHHFIGKDIMYFHALFWPAILKGADYRTPTAIHTHGFLTVNGQKMSKSRGTFIKANTFLQHLSADYLRYYFATKLNDKMEDIDLNWEDFRLRINSDLVGKYINIASRCAGFISKKFNGVLSSKVADPNFFKEFSQEATAIAELYEKRDFNRAMREIMRLADQANQYIAEKAPWTLAKDETQLPQIQAICTMGINLFRLLTLYLKPVLPELSEKVEAFLNITPLTWSAHTQPLLNHKINKFKPLIQRIDEEQIAALQEAAKNESY